MQVLEQIYQQESRRILATLIRLLGDFALAEEALQEAFAAALKQWPTAGIPQNPRAWLVSAGRFKAIDQLRRKARFDASLAELQLELLSEAAQLAPTEEDDSEIEDDRLRLIFTCCHPSLSEEAQLALTLREVCGLTTEEVGCAFLVKPATIAQRIVRAKNKIRQSGIPYEVPDDAQMPTRLRTVLHVIYLLFNEGYSASMGDTVVRQSLCDEAIRLCQLLHGLLPEREVAGLLALMLLQHSRSGARVSAAGSLITLEKQDRSLWDRERITAGLALIEPALSGGNPGTYAVQAAIAALHAEAANYADTDWPQIAGLYGVLLHFHPSPVVELNHAVAIAMAFGEAQGLARIEALLSRGELTDYHLAYAAQADLYRRLGNYPEARAAYQRALSLTRQGPEQAFLHARLDELPGS
ncbi:RNA polymerase sigma factor [Allohahella marinimesophila]|uniref:RNA polymerase sigma factor n=1 Tax=Allohahella marinimesophila TaxID=1054972 RepID=A0ABP7P7V8_9GAMM